ncbi:MAG: hypothetical protein ACTSVI_11025 [Promethearchaeota archaeon]
MGMMAIVTLDISKRDLEDVWENLQVSLNSADGIEPVAMAMVFETYDIMVFFWCDTPENLNSYIIDRMRSIKGVTETTVFFITEMTEIKYESFDKEPGIDGLAFIDVECGMDYSVYKKIIENIKPEEDKTFLKFISHCLHSQNLDLLLGFKGINLYYLDKLFNNIRLIEGVVDVLIIMFSRFKTLQEYDRIREKFPWLI